MRVAFVVGARRLDDEKVGRVAFGVDSIIGDGVSIARRDVTGAAGLVKCGLGGGADLL